MKNENIRALIENDDVAGLRSEITSCTDFHEAEKWVLETLRWLKQEPDDAKRVSWVAIAMEQFAMCARRNLEVLGQKNRAKYQHCVSEVEQHGYWIHSLSHFSGNALLWPESGLVTAELQEALRDLYVLAIREPLDALEGPNEWDTILFEGGYNCVERIVDDFLSHSQEPPEEYGLCEEVIPTLIRSRRLTNTAIEKLQQRVKKGE